MWLDPFVRDFDRCSTIDVVECGVNVVVKLSISNDGRIDDAVIVNVIGLCSHSCRGTLNCLNWIVQNKRERGIKYIHI